MSRPPTGSPDRVEQLEADVASLRAEIARMTEARAPRPWRRRLSGRLAAVALALTLIIPAGAVLASHQFNDVPTNHQFHNAIAAIADAGITTGCGGGNYCPDGLVTRGQMAAFLSRLGALQAGSAPKVNADRVDGRHANQMSRVALMSEGDVSTVIGTSSTPYGPDLVITAPTSGFVLVNMSFTVTSSCVSLCSLLAWARHLQTGADSLPSEVFPASTARASSAITWVFPVSAGENRFQLLMSRTNGTSGSMSGWWAMGTALFTPFGSTGGSTLGSTQAPVTFDKDR